MVGQVNSSANDLTARSYRLPICALACGLLLTIIYLFYQEFTASRIYGQYQRQYIGLRDGQEAVARYAVHRHQTIAGGPVERCTSCHLGIEEAGLKQKVANPYRTHPGELLKNHPPRIFGCISCHGRGGEFLDRCLPSSGDADWRALNRQDAQASCRICHQQAEELKGAPILTAGLKAYRRLGCAGCHNTDELKNERRIGPVLDETPLKLHYSFARDFLIDPQKVRPGTLMPSFFSEEVLSGAPNFSRVDFKAQIDELLAFIYANEVKPNAKPGVSSPTLIEEGRAFYQRLGCRACHVSETQQKSLGNIGPDHSLAKERIRADWLERFLSAPHQVYPQTLMPDFRLDGLTRRALVAYLTPGGFAQNAPNATKDQINRGKILAEKYGCGGCHQSKALKDAPPAGPELDGFGDKRLVSLDWGAWPTLPKERSARLWTQLKLQKPHAFDRRPGVLTMPWQKITDEEMAGLLVLMRSLTKKIPAHLSGLKAHPAAQLSYLRQGETIIGQLNCRQCHTVNNTGGKISSLLESPLDAPPALDGEGRKVQPTWLAQFLSQPDSLRPWLSLRMPSPNLSFAEREKLAGYFAAKDKVSYPFIDEKTVRPLEGERLTQAQNLFTKFQCVRCHLQSNAPQLKPGELAPDLALTGQRLRRQWIIDFIYDPQKLMPGTKMPTLFPLADEDNPRSRITPAPEMFEGNIDAQIKALTDLNIWWKN